MLNEQVFHLQFGRPFFEGCDLIINRISSRMPTLLTVDPYIFVSTMMLKGHFVPISESSNDEYSYISNVISPYSLL